MSVCSHRPSENAGILTPCSSVGGCVCKTELEAELAETQEDE